MSLADEIARVCVSYAPELPDGWLEPDGFVPCCMGSVLDGLRGCTCWEPIFDLEQSRELQEGPPELAVKCCQDCAYRAGSPERESGDVDLDAIAVDGRQAFLCHQGVRRVVGWRHPVLGEVPFAGAGDYRPPQRDGLIWRADGRPGVLCAGWGAVGSRR